jgi:alpha-beta hydrolase superfamily lysophospholipase
VNVPTRRATATAAATLLLLVGLTLVGGSPAHGVERGPNPTNALLEASSGPYSVSSTGVSDFSTPGFGAADIYYPTTTADGTFGGVAIAPGFTATRSSMAWLSRRVASHGFVVININTNSTWDQPSSRGTQLLAALDYLTNSSSARTRVDRNRLAVMGHSMGGGGSLEAASDRPSLDAIVPLTPWNTDKTWSEIQTPTLIIGAENDSVASVSSHSIPFYNSVPSSAEKMYVELNGASHFAPNSTNTTIGKYSVAWLKRFVDQDLRYEQFLCPIPSISTSISDSRGTCPH